MAPSLAQLAVTAALGLFTLYFFEILAYRRRRTGFLRGAAP
ncbi:hypothetical protein [Salinisphaera orenii]